MKQLGLTVFHLSRPLFWMYLAGPFLVGATAGTTSTQLFTQGLFWYLFFCFLIPANIFLYGINDISDRDTDTYNDKKLGKEIKVTTKNTTIYYWAIIISLVFFIPVVFVLQNIFLLVLLLIFFFLATFYSLPPIRFKRRPILDSASNVLYIIPGIFGYVLTSGLFPQLITVISACTWIIAMHLFSAIPDISADKKAHLQTTAVVIGKRNSLLACTMLWSISVFSISTIHPVFLFGIIYPLLPLYILYTKKTLIKKIYWAFPSINFCCGVLLYGYVAMKLL